MTGSIGTGRCNYGCNHQGDKKRYTIIIVENDDNRAIESVESYRKGNYNLNKYDLKIVTNIRRQAPKINTRIEPILF